MGYFKYEARNVKEMKIERDTLEADNLKDAMAKLKDMGLTVLHIEQTFTKPGEKPFDYNKKPLDKALEKAKSIISKIRTTVEGAIVKFSEKLGSKGK